MSVLVSLAACGRGETRPTAQPVRDDVVATVNGAPIYVDDLRVRVAAQRIPGKLTPEHKRNLLEAVIRDELIYQRAVELGLDDDPAYQRMMRHRQAQLDATRRNYLGDAFFRHLVDQARPTDAQVRAYFEERRARLSTEVHILQILTKSRDAADAVAAKLAGGASFEQVAAERLRLPPDGELRPWDAGYMKWTQLPEPWRDVVPDLQPGETSGVIAGPGGRFWIVMLVDRRERPDVSLDELRPVIEQELRRQAVEAAREQADQELGATAEIVYSKEPIPDLVSEPEP